VESRVHFQANFLDLFERDGGKTTNHEDRPFTRAIVPVSAFLPSRHDELTSGGTTGSMVVSRDVSYLENASIL
jgi:hypothetical protein